MRSVTLLLLLLATPAIAGPKPKNVAIVVYDNAEILDLAGPTEVLAVASNFGGVGGRAGLNVYLVGRTTKAIKAQGFVEITPTYSIDNAPTPDLVIIPGGNSNNLSNDAAMMKWLTAVTRAADATLTVCTGAFPLARAGQLDGLEVTTWFGAVDKLRKIAPKVKVTHGRRFVDNGRYITTAGVSAGIDGALHLTARLFGRRVADQTARYMEYHWTPEPYLATGYTYWNPSLDERGRKLQSAEAALEEKRIPEALALLEKLAATDTDGSTWVTLANARFGAGDRKGAVVAYLRVGEKSASYKVAVYNLACAYALLGDKPKAIAAIKKALAAGITKTQALGDPDLAAIKNEIASM